MTVSKKDLATVVAVYGWHKGMKCPYLENMSTTVRMIDLLLMRGNLSMKSMAMSAQTIDDTLRG
jgi:hypothetical protein